MLTAEPTDDIQRAIAWVDGRHDRFLYSPPEDVEKAWAAVVEKLVELDRVLGGQFYAAAEAADTAYRSAPYGTRRLERPLAHGEFADALIGLFLSVCEVRVSIRQFRSFANAMSGFEARLEAVLMNCPKYHGELREWFFD